MEKSFAICRVAVAPIRADKSDRAEIVSQLLFGEHVEIVGAEDRWTLIRNGYDNYEGWVDFKQITQISEEEFNLLQDCKFLAPLRFDNPINDSEGGVYHLSAGSNLPFYENGSCKVGAARYTFDFEPHHPEKADFDRDILSITNFFLNTPYLWGGRSVVGIDCSGFVQTVFKMLGIKLRRDASQQAEQGEMVAFLSAAKTGDVAFFDNEEGRIIHVGILLSNQQIIHASGKVKIDPIDDQGIYSQELGRYTHKLRIIKRFV